MSIINYLLFYLISALNIVFGINKKKSNVLCLLALIIIFVLMAFNYYGPDIEAYVLTYKSVGEATSLSGAFDATYMEHGYVTLMYLSNKISFDFYAFRIVITLICLTLFVATIKYFKVNPNIVIGLYMLHLFFFDEIQFRNCIVQFIILFAIRFLFDKSQFSIIKYFICIAVAASIHSVALIYLSLLLTRFWNKGSSYKRVFLFSLFVFLTCILLRPILPQILNIISMLIKRGGNYLSNSSRFSYIVVMVFYLFSLMVLYSYKNTLRNIDVKNNIENIIKVKIIIGLFLSLCIIDGSFYRIFRNLFLLDIIGMALLYFGLKKQTHASNIVMLSELIFVCGWLATDLIRNSTMDIIGFAMKYNLIFDNVELHQMLIYVSITTICLFVIGTMTYVFKTTNRVKSANKYSAVLRSSYIGEKYLRKQLDGMWSQKCSKDNFFRIKAFNCDLTNSMIENFEADVGNDCNSLSELTFENVYLRRKSALRSQICK